MVKVVGKNDQHVKRTTCRNCASILEYTRNEATPHIHYDYGGGSDTYYWITCPNCGKDVNVGSNL